MNSETTPTGTPVDHLVRQLDELLPLLRRFADAVETLVGNECGVTMEQVAELSAVVDWDNQPTRIRTAVSGGIRVWNREKQEYGSKERPTTYGQVLTIRRDGFLSLRGVGEDAVKSFDEWFDCRGFGPRWRR